MGRAWNSESARDINDLETNTSRNTRVRSSFFSPGSVLVMFGLVGVRLYFISGLALVYFWFSIGLILI